MEYQSPEQLSVFDAKTKGYPRTRWLRFHTYWLLPIQGVISGIFAVYYARYSGGDLLWVFSCIYSALICILNWVAFAETLKLTKKGFYVNMALFYIKIGAQILSCINAASTRSASAMTLILATFFISIAIICAMVCVIVYFYKRKSLFGFEESRSAEEYPPCADSDRAAPVRKVPDGRTVFLTERKNAGWKCIYSLPCLLFAAVMLIIALNTKSIYSRTEIYYIVSLLFSAAVGVSVFINAKKIWPSPVLTNISLIFSIGTLIPLMTGRIWADGNYNSTVKVLLVWALILLAADFIVQACYTIVTDINLYRRSAYHKMRGYAKLDKINTLKERGIITEEEYAKFVQQITEAYGIAKETCANGICEAPKRSDPAGIDEGMLDEQIIERLCSLSPEELAKVDVFVQGLLAKH